jgi:hypothetical protein
VTGVERLGDVGTRELDDRLLALAELGPRAVRLGIERGRGRRGRGEASNLGEDEGSERLSAANEDGIKSQRQFVWQEVEGHLLEVVLDGSLHEHTLRDVGVGDELQDGASGQPTSFALQQMVLNSQPP